MHSDKLWRWTMAGAIALVGAGIWFGPGSVGAWSREARAGHASLAASPTAVCVVDLNKVMNNLDEKPVRERETKALGEERQKQIDEINAKLKAARDELSLLPRGTEEYRKKVEEVYRLQQQTEFEFEFAKALLNERQARNLIELFNKIQEAAASYAEREGYQIVLRADRAGEPLSLEDGEREQSQRDLATRMILYSADAVDISAAVAQWMNNEFKAGGGATKPR